MRLFIAFPLPENIKEYIDEKLTRKLRRTKAKVSWVREENLHITLKFIGDSDDVEEIKSAIHRAVVGFGIVDTKLGEIGSFGGRSPKVIWLRPIGGEETLTEIVDEIEENLASCGFEKEKRIWSPHITLGRVRKPDAGDELIRELRGLEYEKKGFIIDRVVLMKSTLTPKGAVYNIIHEEFLKT